MWVLRWTLIALIIIVVLGVSLQNTGKVEIVILKWQSGEIPIYLVIYVSFAAGMIVFLIVATYYQISHQMLIRKMVAQIKELKSRNEELENSESEDDTEE